MNLDFFKMWHHTFQRELNSRRIRAVNSIVFVTYRCTSRCSTCNIWQRVHKSFKDRELSPDAWTHVIEKLSRYGISTLELFGGDVLLRKDAVFPMIQQCTQLSMDTCLPTNSNLLNQETAQKLVSDGLGTIYFSVDGIDDLHDTIRGVNGTFTRVRQAILNIAATRSRSRRNNPKIEVITTVSNMNIEQIENIVSELERFPLDSVSLQAMGEITEGDVERSTIEGISATPFFVSASGTTHLLSEEQAHFLKRTLKRLRQPKSTIPFYLGLSHVEPLHVETFTQGIFPPFPCHICRTVVTLTPYGEVVPCPFFTDFVLGNLNDENSLDSIWGNEKHRRFLRKQRSGAFAVCRKCSMRHFYPGLRETFRQVFYPYLYAPFMNRRQ